MRKNTYNFSLSAILNADNYKENLLLFIFISKFKRQMQL